MSSLQRRLPGVRFEAPPAALREALPRMDIAMFVGFAASGPVDLPVAVESLPEFEAIYGGELVLARDRSTGAEVGGLLHPAVRGFFSQGGRRCWIVRVAAAAAETSRFPLASLVLARRTESGWRIEPALIAARSPGSWADGLRVATRLVVRAVRVRPVPPTVAVPAAVDVLGAAALALRSGELLRFAIPHVGPVQAAIASMDAVGSDADGRLVRRIHLRGAAMATAIGHADDPGELVDAAGFDGDDAALPASGTWRADARYTVRCRVSAGRVPDPGAVLSLRFAGSPERSLRLVVAGTVLLQAGGLDGSVDLELTGRLFGVDADLGTSLRAWLAGGAEQPAQWLQLGLRAGTGDDLDFSLEQLGMAAPVDADGAGLGIANLPDDQRFFVDAGDAAGSHGAAEAAFELTRRDTFGRLTKRFPLASLGGDAESMLIPLGDEAAYGPGLGALGSDRPALERDGLADFSWRLFAEPLLASHGADSLADQAESLRLLGTQLRPLRGMHAAFGAANSGVVDEPTLLAVPDAVHAGWQRVPDPPSPWRRQPPPPAEPVASASACDFSDCALTPLAAPQFVRGADPDGAGDYTVQWTEPEPGLVYELEEAGDVGFVIETLAYRGEARRFAVVGKRSGSQFYRVRASVGARRSPWSAAVEIIVGLRGYEPLPWSAANTLAVHRLMLRTAAGRGDMLAVLALPAHYRFDDACAHAGSLRDARAAVADADAPRPIGDDEMRALSHGALYHPWLLTRRASGVVASPPDGAACGQLAASALERGAWLAVANRPLRDVVAVGAAASQGDMQNLLDAQVNGVRASPHGFVLATAETLSPEPDWRPINVRRLMTLLRRLALRRGATYVFEPNGATLRRTVERGFEAVMDELFRRGAFAGGDARTAYRVEVGDEVNTPARNDLGQFWVELKVAPALPLTFLTVRLARSGERLVARETR